MIMIGKIQKWGNSQGLRISKEILEQSKLMVGDPVEVIVENGVVLIRRFNEKKKYNLEKMVSEISQDYTVSETDWGNPTGKEVWFLCPKQLMR